MGAHRARPTWRQRQARIRRALASSLTGALLTAVVTSGVW